MKWSLQEWPMNKILLLDDNVDLCILVENILQRHNYEIKTTTSEEEFVT